MPQTGRYEAREAFAVTPNGHHDRCSCGADTTNASSANCSRCTSWLYTPPNPPFFNSSLNLTWNPALEHSRDGRYWSSYDLMGNMFAEEGLRLMTAAATRAFDDHSAGTFRAYRKLLQSGINTSLAKDVRGDGSGDVPIYAELRPVGPGTISPSDDLLWGMSWVNLAAVPSHASLFSAREDHSESVWLDPARMDATMKAYRRMGYFVWMTGADTNFSAPAAEMPFTHINASTHGVPFAKPGFGQQVDDAVIGKGFAWELAWAAHRGDWPRVVAMQRFVAQWSYEVPPSGSPAGTFWYRTFFGESYWYDGYLGNPKQKMWESDPSNGEQASWFVWASTVVRNQLLKSTH